MHQITNCNIIKDMVFGGKATITVESRRSGKWFTYKIRKSKTSSTYFVSVLNGPDNTRNYTYIGAIFNTQVFKHTQNSKVLPSAVSFIAFDWFFRTMLNNDAKLNESLNVYHSGTCARCGRKLTTPESVLTGFGPECSALKGVIRVKSNTKVKSEPELSFNK